MPVVLFARGRAARIRPPTLVDHWLVGVVQDRERRLADAVWRHRTPRAVAAARLVGMLGAPAVAAGVTALAAICGRGRHRLAPIAAVAAGAASRRLAAELIGRPRPPVDVWRVPVAGPSLPSKHTTWAVLAAGALVRAYPASGLPRWPVPTLIGAAVGSARVIVGAHWPLDALAGIGTGLGWWWLVDRCTEGTP